MLYIHWIYDGSSNPVDAKIAKWGNSLALRLPKALASELGWGEDVRVELEVRGGELVVKPLPKVYSLEELVAQITDENRHGELDWGSPRGAEHW